jgi:hypothetical protein
MVSLHVNMRTVCMGKLQYIKKRYAQTSYHEDVQKEKYTSTNF